MSAWWVVAGVAWLVAGVGMFVALMRHSPGPPNEADGAMLPVCLLAWPIVALMVIGSALSHLTKRKAR